MKNEEVQDVIYDFEPNPYVLLLLLSSNLNISLKFDI